MPFDLSKLSVLVAEDTVPMRKILVSVLDVLGVGKIFSAGDGEAAFERFRKECPDIVLTDWAMDPTDGIQLTREIRTSVMSPNRMVPIILFTGYSAATRVALARDAGVTEFLVKPFSASDLAKRLAYVINKPRDFIDMTGFFGPDRRRRDDPDFNGPWRRASDGGKKN